MTVDQPGTVVGGGTVDPDSYVPAVMRRWAPRPGPEGDHLLVTGTLVSADLSGFTALSERLARFGKEGAETLTQVLNQVFTEMIDAVVERGGDILKFGGDALLILFEGAASTERAADAALAMRHIVATPVVAPRGGRVHLRISQGLHRGRFQLYAIDGGHTELVITGPDATETVDCEGEAEAGEILLSAAASAAVDPGRLGPARDGRHPLLERPDDAGSRPARLATRPDAGDAARFLPGALLDQILVGAPPEHRRATVAFLAFGGTDETLREAGEPEVARRLARVATAVGRATQRYGVHWLATDIAPAGGKFILAAGAPTSSGDDEDHLLQALRTILDDLDQPDDLEVRAGVNCGHVFVGDLGSATRRTFTVMGDAVNLAARLMGKATPGQVVASDEVLDRIRTDFELTPLEPFMVKGKSAPIHAAVVGRVGHEGGGTAGGGRLPLLGRDAELEVLLAAVDEAATGHGRVVELLGEAGTGKSRLLEEARDQRPSMRAHIALCGPYAQASPYFAARTLLRPALGLARDLDPEAAGRALTETVRRAAPDLLPWLPLLAMPLQASVPMTPEAARVAPEFRRDRSHQLTADLLEHTVTRHTAFVVEDAHWLDDASGELLGELARRSHDRPWVICRSGRAPLPDLGEVEPPPVVVELEPLDPRAAMDLAVVATGAGDALRPGEWETIADRGAGNPLFVIELARAAATQGSSEALAGSVESLVMSRLDTLDPADRRLLREAAVMGAVVDVPVLRAAVGPHVPDRVEQWGHLGAFVEPMGGHRLRFLHSLYREVAYEGLSYGHRRTVHRRIAEEIERETLDPSDRADLLSTHFHAAGARPESWYYSREAGDAARALSAIVEAATFYRRALEAARRLRSLDDADHAQVAESLGDVLELGGRYDEAADAYRLARRRRHGLDEVRLMRKEGLVRERAGSYPAAVRWWNRAARRLDELGGDPSIRAAEQAAIDLEMAGVRHRQGRYSEQIRWAQRAAGHAERAGDRGALARAWYLLESGLSVLGRPEATDYRALPLPIYEELGDDLGRANVLNNLAVSANSDGDLEGAVAMFAESEHYFDRGGDVVGAATAALNRGEMLSYLGRLDEAVEVLADALRTMRAARYALGVAYTLGIMGHVDALRGHHSEGLAELDESIDRCGELGAQGIEVDMRARRVEALVHAGRPEEALAEADTATAILEAGDPDPLVVLQLRRNRAAAMFTLGRVAEALDLVDRAVADAGEDVYPQEVARTLELRELLVSADAVAG